MIKPTSAILFLPAIVFAGKNDDLKLNFYRLSTSICAYRLRECIGKGAISKSILTRPLGLELGKILRFQKEISGHQKFSLYILKSQKYLEYEFIFVVSKQKIIFADVNPVAPMNKITYGDRVWYFLTNNDDLIYWAPYFSRIHKIDLDKIERDGEYKDGEESTIDFSSPEALVPPPFAVRRDIKDPDQWILLRNALEVIPNGGVSFYRIKK